MGILIKKAGILDTLQDFGRIGFRKFGINPNGAMDRNALRLINTILRNKDEDVALEIHFPASKIIFKSSVVFAIGGADFVAQLNSRKIDNWMTLVAKKGDQLNFVRRKSGNRCYLAIRGGFDIEQWLGSGSTNLAGGVGGLDGRKLQTGDIIPARESAHPTEGESSIKIAYGLRDKPIKEPTLRFTAGAEFKTLTALSELSLVKNSFQVTSDSNRMGFRLAGDPLFQLSKKELVSSAVSFGTIQLLPNGQLVVLMADHQTTGGYPRIGNIVEPDLSKIAQSSPGDNNRFKLVSLEEAERIRLEFERDLSFLRMGVRFRTNDGNG